MGQSYDIWDVNVEDEYHEEHREPSRRAGGGGDRLVPGRVAKVTIEEALGKVFGKYDSVALGSAVAVIAGAPGLLGHVDPVDQGR